MITEQQRQELIIAARPLMEWLHGNCHPHITAIVDSEVAEVTEGLATIHRREWTNNSTATEQSITPPTATYRGISKDRLGKAAYDAYCETRGWKSVRGEPLPSFIDQSEDLKNAWNEAAIAVVKHLNSQPMPACCPEVKS